MNELIRFERNPVIESGIINPLSLANQPFPYNGLANPRRFEELLYSIFNIQIKNGKINDYTEVNLLTGVRDKGRDCALLKDGKNYGLIQCKKYDTNYGKNDLCLEIVRFVLYSMSDNRLVYDYDDFTYYICVSTGLTSDCIEFINQFSENILHEPSLTEWIDKNLQMPSLSHLKKCFDLSDFKRKISRIKVKKITPAELDIYLNSDECRDLISLFFEVRSVTDNTKIDQLIDIISNQEVFEPADLLGQLKIGSARLQSERNFFQDIEQTHVDRIETKQLFDWIVKETPDIDHKNICLLAGEAGYGKTVVIKDLYNLCIADDIAVLGLKVDKLYSNTHAALQQSLGLSKPVFKFIEDCKKHFNKIVILIDQIDALSQSMSSDRSFLEFYRSFIEHFSYDKQIRIIISVRNSDLHYDPSLKIYKDMDRVVIGPLELQKVIELLNIINVNPNELSAKLLELLRIPNYLNIFSQIVSNKNIFKADSVLELYLELWDQKISKISKDFPVLKSKLKELLYKIAQQMFYEQRISVSSLNYDDYYQEIQYLKSERLLKSDGRQLQFFHQSFYDFVFAKCFVETNENLFDYIIEGDQSIHIRSAVKMIISYLRESDPNQYEKSLKQIFFNTEVLFHIKHIILVEVLGQGQPAKEEFELVKSAFKESFQWQTVFFDNALAPCWLSFAVKNDLFEVIKENYHIDSKDSEIFTKDHIVRARFSCIYFLSRYVNQNLDLAWDTVMKIDDPEVAADILFSLNNWEHPSAYMCFEFFEQHLKLDTYRYFHILSNIAHINPESVYQRMIPEFKKFDGKNNKHNDHYIKEVLKTLGHKIPHLMINSLYESINFNEEDCLINGHQIIKDYRFYAIDFKDNDLKGSEIIYQLLAQCLRRSAGQEKIIFKKFLSDHKNSHLQSILRLLLYALKGSEKIYSKEIFELFCIFNNKDLLLFVDDIEYDMRVLLERTFVHFNSSQQKIVLDTIRNFTSGKEIYIRKLAPNSKRLVSHWGLSKYYLIKRLPSSVISKEFQKEFGELERKFEGRNADVRQRESTMAGLVVSPIPIEVCAKMSVKEWLKAFKKYNNDDRKWGRDYLKGGLQELAAVFKTVVSQSLSDDKLNIISEAISNDEVNLRYAVYGLWGWLEGGGDTVKIKEFVKTVLTQASSYENRLLVTIASQMTREDSVDPDFVQFLIDNALKFEEGNNNVCQLPSNEETSIYGLVTKAINTDYGAAINAITLIQNRYYDDLIFETLNTVINFGPREARAAVYFRFAYLKKLNIEKAESFFVDGLEKEEDIYVVASSIHSFEYFRGRNYARLLKVYDRLITSGLLGSEDRKMLFLCIYGLYLNNDQGVLKTLLDLINHYGNSLGIYFGEIFKNYYLIPDSKDKNDFLLNYILDAAIAKDADDLNFSFIHAEDVLLKDVFPFFKRFVESPIFKISDYFIEYLLIQVANSPDEAIELFDLAVKQNQDIINSAWRTEEKSIKFIINAYHKMSMNDEKSRELRRKLLFLFDNLLKNLTVINVSGRILKEL